MGFLHSLQSTTYDSATYVGVIETCGNPLGLEAPCSYKIDYTSCSEPISIRLTRTTPPVLNRACLLNPQEVPPHSGGDSLMETTACKHRTCSV